MKYESRVTYSIAREAITVTSTTIEGLRAPRKIIDAVLFGDPIPRVHAVQPPLTSNILKNVSMITSVQKGVEIYAAVLSGDPLDVEEFRDWDKKRQAYLQTIEKKFTTYLADAMQQLYLANRTVTRSSFGHLYLTQVIKRYISGSSYEEFLPMVDHPRLASSLQRRYALSCDNAYEEIS